MRQSWKVRYKGRSRICWIISYMSIIELKEYSFDSDRYDSLGSSELIIAVLKIRSGPDRDRYLWRSTVDTLSSVYRRGRPPGYGEICPFLLHQFFGYNNNLPWFWVRLTKTKTGNLLFSGKIKRRRTIRDCFKYIKLFFRSQKINLVDKE